MGIRTDGVYTVLDLKRRCHIVDLDGVDRDDGCGECWRWRLACEGRTPRVTISHKGKRQKMAGRRAALILSGVEIPAEHEAFPTEECGFDDCVNPAHSRTGTRQAHRRFLASRGRWSLPHCYAHLLPYAQAKRKIDDADRLAIAASDKPLAVLALEFGVCEDTVSKYKRGGLRRSPASSVFDWRG